MKKTFAWDGVDGKGKALKVYVHDGFEMVNAYWDGEAAYFGDGDCDYGPLTTHEVISHEFTHGMIQHTSNLVYEGDPGAMNESIADIFGKYIELKMDSLNFSWSLAHSFIIADTAKPFRILDDPKQLEMPAYYGGEFFNPDNDVHTNSSIGNLWFSMITQGKKGTNEIDSTFDVAAIGFDKAARIVFETNQNYLSEMSDYNAFYKYSAGVAEDLYGANSTEYKSVVEAWKAVGLPKNLPSSAVDLEILGYEITACADLNQIIPMTIRIGNNGSEKYTPATTDKLIIDVNGKLYKFKIDSTIDGGEIIEFKTKAFWKVTDFNNLFINVTLNVNDANTNNNTTFLDVIFLKNGAPDLELAYASATKLACFKKEVILSFDIENLSCEPFPAGKPMKLIATDNNGTVLWDTSFVLSNPVTSFEYLNFIADISEPIFDLSLESSTDPDPTNNDIKFVEISNIVSTIKEAYTNDFEDQTKKNDYMSIQASTFNPFLTIDNNSLFASTGWNGVEYLPKVCTYTPNVFKNGFAGINATLSTCVDYTQYNDASIAFDVMQYRNVTTDTTNYQYSSMLEVKWEGNESGSKLIYNEKEGELKHFDLALPKQFKGEVTFKLYTEAGNIEPDIANLETDDFILLDNVEFIPRTVATNDVPNKEIVTIFPNPTSDKVTVQVTKPIEAITLYDINGRMVKKEISTAQTINMDISNLNTGFYVLKVSFKDGNSISRKVIKMEREF
jgi:hypothetical protein